MVTCRPASVNGFPSETQPILDTSVMHGGDPTGSSHAPGFVWRLTGFAADPVAKVAVVGVDGNKYDLTPVIHNVYLASNNLTSVPPKEIIAFDASGKQIYSQCESYGGCG